MLAPQLADDGFTSGRTLTTSLRRVVQGQPDPPLGVTECCQARVGSATQARVSENPGPLQKNPHIRSPSGVHSSTWELANCGARRFLVGG